jgi:hypothetical protein
VQLRRMCHNFHFPAIWRAWKSWGSGCPWLLHLQIRIPAPDHHRVFPLQGRDTLPHHDLEMLLLRLLTADIPPVNANCDGAIGDRQRLPIGGTTLHKGPWLLTPLGVTAVGDRECVILHGFDIQCRIHWEKVFAGLHREPRGDKGGPFGLYEHQFWGGRFGQKGGERTECRGGALLTGIVIDAGAGERDGAKERLEGPGVLAFGAKRGPTRVTARMCGQKCGHLLGQQVLLKLRQQLLGFGHGQTEMLNPFCLVFLDDNVLDSSLVIVVGMDNAL